MTFMHSSFVFLHEKKKLFINNINRSKVKKNRPNRTKKAFLTTLAESLNIVLLFSSIKIIYCL